MSGVKEVGTNRQKNKGDYKIREVKNRICRRPVARRGGGLARLSKRI